MFPKGQIFALDGQICPGLQEKRMARGCLGIGQPASIPMAWGAVRTHPHAFRPIREHQGHNGAARRPQSFIPAIVCIIPTNAAARCPGTQPGHHGRRTSMAADFHAFSRISLTCWASTRQCTRQDTRRMSCRIPKKHPVKPWFDGSGIVKKCGYLTQFHGRGNKVRKNPPKKIRGS